jgi:hypothetical protein
MNSVWDRRFEPTRHLFHWPMVCTIDQWYDIMVGSEQIKHLSPKSYEFVSFRDLTRDLYLHELELMPLLLELKAAKRLELDIEIRLDIIDSASKSE